MAHKKSGSSSLAHPRVLCFPRANAFVPQYLIGRTTGLLVQPKNGLGCAQVTRGLQDLRRLFPHLSIGDLIISKPFLPLNVYGFYGLE